MRTLLLVTVVCLGWAATGRAGFVEDLDKARAEGPAAVEKVEKAYAESEAKNPKYYIDLANYWFGVSQQVNISTKPAAGADYAVADKKTGKPVGSISRTGVVDPRIGQKAPDLLKKATEKFPERVDIWLGLAFILRKEDRPVEAGKVMLTLLERTRKTPGVYMNKKGEAISFEESAGYVDNAAYDTTAELYRAETKEASKVCGELAKSMIETFPEDVRPYNILAALADENGDKKGALAWLEKAHEVDPEDAIVALNLGDNYLQAGNKAKAREMAQSVLNSKTEEAKPYHGDAKALLDAAK